MLTRYIIQYKTEICRVRFATLYLDFKVMTVPLSDFLGIWFLSVRKTLLFHTYRVASKRRSSGRGWYSSTECQPNARPLRQ
jgi:hypothetical protein